MHVRSKAEAFLGAAHDRGRITAHDAADGHDIAADLRLRAELHITQYRDHIAVDRTVDVDIAQYGNGVVAHGTGDTSISEYRYHRVGDFPGTGRRAENGDDRIGAPIRSQQHIVA